MTISTVDAELAHLRRETVGDDGQPHQRTSVMTHIVWAPPEWLEAAERTLEGLGERHPSRTVILVPTPEEPDGIDARLSVRSFPVGDRAVSSEVIELTLRGERSCAPASVVLPLTISDLPVFLRWRGEPLFGETQWEQLVGVADRVIVDSSEWAKLRYHELADVFELTAVSDIAWARIDEWRITLAAHWPEIADPGDRHPRAAGRGRAAPRLARLAARSRRGSRRAGRRARRAPRRRGGRAPARDDRTPSDLLSAELDKLVRDLIYEQAVFAQGALP